MGHLERGREGKRDTTTHTHTETNKAERRTVNLKNSHFKYFFKELVFGTEDAVCVSGLKKT